MPLHIFRMCHIQTLAALVRSVLGGGGWGGGGGGGGTRVQAHQLPDVNKTL